jgi:hypothetical protein
MRLEIVQEGGGGVLLARPMKAAVAGAPRNSVLEGAVVGHQDVRGAGV